MKFLAGTCLRSLHETVVFNGTLTKSCSDFFQSTSPQYNLQKTTGFCETLFLMGLYNWITLGTSIPISLLKSLIYTSLCYFLNLFQNTGGIFCTDMQFSVTDISVRACVCVRGETAVFLVCCIYKLAYLITDSMWQKSIQLKIFWHLFHNAWGIYYEFYRFITDVHSCISSFSTS